VQRTKPPSKRTLEALRKLRQAEPNKRVWLYFQDEARFGLKPTYRGVWAPISQRPTAPSRARYDWSYVFATVHPETGTTHALILPVANTKAMQLYLDDFAASLPALLKREEGFIGSIASQEAWGGGAAGAGLFAAAKGAVATFLRSLDADLAHTQVGVAIIFPMGPVDTLTNRTRFHDTDPAHLIHPFAIAQAFVAAATSGVGGRLLEIPVHPPRAVQ